MKLGTNLDSVKDYSAHLAFADCMRMARAFGSVAAPYDGKAPLGPDGYPTSDFGMVIHTGVNPVGGTYKLSFTGKADVSLSASNGKIENYKFDGVTSTADIVLADNSQLFLIFRNTVGVKNLSLIRPGCLSSQLFNPAFLASVKPFSVIRFMDWLRTNDSVIKTWADRKRPEELLQSGERGVCLEYCLELCNQVGADAWLCVPHMADDDYVQKMAELVKAKLKPELKVYVEYSNEVWNTQFSQTEWNHQRAVQEVSTGDKTLSLEGTDTNTFYWGRRRVAKRIAEISKRFSGVLGADRSRAVLASHVADPSVGRAQLGYLAKYFTSVSSVIYGVAGAPYFATKAHIQDLFDPITNKKTGEIVKPGSTVQTVLDGLKSSITSNIAKWVPQPWDGVNTDPNTPSLASLAKYHGTNFLFYECGQHLISGKDLERQKLERAAQLDPQMYTMMGDYLKGMLPSVDTACYFVNVSAWQDGQFGYWGATYQLDIETPKSKALFEAAVKFNAPPPTEVDLLKAQIVELKKTAADFAAQVVQKNKDLDLALTALRSKQIEVDTLNLKIQKLESFVAEVKASVAKLNQ